MIKTTVIILQLLVLFSIAIISMHFFRPMQRISIFACCGCFFVFSFLSLKFTHSFFKLKEEIVITALNEKSENSKGTEVDIQNLFIDGDTIIATRLPITNGQWYSVYGRCSWRPNTDTRWDGTASNSITLKIPVGWSRAIRFHESEWQGIVSIEKPKGGIAVLDTFSEEEKIYSYYIGKSDTKLLLLQGISDIICYTLILGIQSLLFVWIIKRGDLQK